MALSFENESAASQIVSMYQERRQNRAGIFNRMDEVRRHYNGDVMVPLPELDDMEKPAIPNLIAQGIDQFAMRVASTMPDIAYPALRPGIQASEAKSRDRRLANIGWWDMNKMGTKVRRRARHLTAYGMSAVTLSPVSLDPNDRREIPHWRVRNPLSTYPSPMVDPDSMEPTDCIFADHRPLGWLKANYPKQMSVLYKGKSADTDLFTVLEYMDDVETVVIVVGAKRAPSDYVNPGSGVAHHQVLDRIANRSEVCPVVIAGRITLDRLQGQFDQMLGMYQREAKLDALNTIAVFRNVFPDEWIVSPANSPSSPRIVQEADGKQGIRGIIDKGQVQIVHVNPGAESQTAMDRLERAQRLTAGMPAELGGESGSNIRTARRGASVLSSAIDMPLQEYQEILGNSMELENQRAVKIMKSYYGSKPSMFFFGSDGKIARPDYTPDETFETDMSYVKYSMPGADANGMVVQVGQMVGLGAMSKQTAMEMLPQIEDPVRERDQVELEGLRQALLAGLEQQASAGTLDPNIIARIAKKKAERHVTLEDAVSKIHEEMQEEQAAKANAQAQPQPEASPEMQPGLAQSPENPIQGPTPAGPQGKPSIQDLLASLHTQSEASQVPNPMPAGTPIPQGA
jgi:hypothetical protein